MGIRPLLSPGPEQGQLVNVIHLPLFWVVA
jgi:hypothetical protein